MTQSFNFKLPPNSINKISNLRIVFISFELLPLFIANMKIVCILIMIFLSFGALGKHFFLTIIIFEIKRFQHDEFQIIIYDFLVHLYESLSKCFYYLDACCCSYWLGYLRCGCNIFGCNCDYAHDDYCYYTKWDPGNTYELLEDCPTGNWYWAIRSTERCSSVTLNDGVC